MYLTVSQPILITRTTEQWCTGRSAVLTSECVPSTFAPWRTHLSIIPNLWSYFIRVMNFRDFTRSILNCLQTLESDRLIHHRSRPQYLRFQPVNRLYSMSRSQVSFIDAKTTPWTKLPGWSPFLLLRQVFRSGHSWSPVNRVFPGDTHLTDASTDDEPRSISDLSHAARNARHARNSQLGQFGSTAC